MNVSKHSDQLRVSSATVRFRRDLQLGKQPAIEQHLADSDDAERAELFRELLSLELSSLRESGTEPRLETYLERFPHFETIVREQFSGFDSFQMSMDSTRAHDTSALAAASGSGHPVGSKPQLKRYRLLERIGQGGFGEVWRAYDEEANRHVAIKGPRTDRVVTPDRVATFLAEAQRVREIGVDGVVSVLDVVHAPATPTSAPLCFIVMELMEGGSLEDRISGGVGRRQAVRWLASLSDTLAELHRRDVVHRDIKPENILFDKRGRLYLSDFGLAATEDEQLAEEPGVLGTVAYMAPEQARGTHVDRRADIYSLGVVLYRLLSGNKLPYLARTRQDFLEQLLDEHIAPRAMPETVPSQLAHVCERCVHKEASQRYRTASELGRELRSWLNGRRNIAALAGVAIVLLALTLPVTAYLRSFGGQSIGPAAAAIPADVRPPDGSRGDNTALGEAGTASATPAAGNPLPLARANDPLNDPELQLPVYPIAWPQDDVSNWTLLESGNTLHVSSNHISLLGIGKVKKGQDLTFEIDIRQLEWTGRAGVFLGHRSDGNGAMRFESIELRNYDSHFECLRSVRDYQHTPDGMSEFQIARAEIPPPDHAQALSIDIKLGRIAAVRWNGAPLERLVKLKPRDDAKVADCSGAIGFFNMASAAAYSRLHLDGELVRMRELVGEQSP